MPVAEAATLIGVAGSVTTVAAIALDLPEYDPVAIHPGRVDVIGAGALLLRVIMDEFGLSEVVVSEHDILDGIALRLARG